jgi:hypothetical protein
MSVSHFAPAPEPGSSTAHGVAALVYRNEVYPEAAFQALVDRARVLGFTLAGVLQHPAFEGADRRCDVVLEDLASGHRTPLFENRGRGARGCRLDEAALAEATARIEGSLEMRPDLLVLSKFGKVECDGGGLRDLIADAIDRGIPVIIGVPDRNLDAWRDFAGDFSVELSEEGDEIDRWVRSLSSAGQAANA